MKTFKEILQDICNDSDNTGCDGLYTVREELIIKAKQILQIEDK